MEHIFNQNLSSFAFNAFCFDFFRFFTLIVPLLMPYLMVRYMKGSKKTTRTWIVVVTVCFIPCLLHALLICVFLAPVVLLYSYWLHIKSNRQYTLKSYSGHAMATEYAKFHTELMREGANPNYAGFYSKSADFIKQHMAKESFNEGHVLFHNGKPVCCLSMTCDDSIVEGYHILDNGLVTNSEYKGLGLAAYTSIRASVSPQFLSFQLWNMFFGEQVANVTVFASPISYLLFARRYSTVYPSPQYPTKENIPEEFRKVYEQVQESTYGIPDEPVSEFATKCSSSDKTKFDAKRISSLSRFYLQKMNPTYPVNTQMPLAMAPLSFDSVVTKLYMASWITARSPKTTESRQFKVIEPRFVGKTVAIVDPVSSGAKLATYVMENGAEVICVSTEGCFEEVQSGQTFLDEFMHESMEATVKRIKSHGNIDAVLIGCDTGVTVAEELALKLGLRGNKPSFNRRNKFIQQEKCRSHKINACRQAYATSMDEVEQFLSTFNPSPFRAVVKPVDGAGSLSVIKCSSPEEVRQAFETVKGLYCYGNVCSGALIQEFLEGEEFIVNTVTLDGKHKVVGVFCYDKRTAYGSDFVYFGSKTVPESDSRFRALVDYAINVVNAMEIEHGAAHLEIMFTKVGPVLVECNCRIAGASGYLDKAEKLMCGQGQIIIYANAMLEPQSFCSVPDVLEAKGDAFIGHLHVNQTGKFVDVNEKNEFKMMKLPSFVQHKLWLQKGDVCQRSTGDMETLLGLVLYSEDSNQVKEDYEMFHQINNESFIIFEEKKASGCLSGIHESLDSTAVFREVFSEGN